MGVTFPAVFTSFHRRVKNGSPCGQARGHGGKGVLVEVISCTRMERGNLRLGENGVTLATFAMGESSLLYGGLFVCENGVSHVSYRGGGVEMDSETSFATFFVNCRGLFETCRLFCTFYGPDHLNVNIIVYFSTIGCVRLNNMTIYVLYGVVYPGNRPLILTMNCASYFTTRCLFGSGVNGIGGIFTTPRVFHGKGRISTTTFNVFFMPFCGRLERNITRFVGTLLCVPRNRGVTFLP